MQGGLVQIMCNIIKCSIVVTLIVQSIYSTEIKNGKLLYSEKEIVDTLVKTWSPLVWLAPNEKFLPGDVRTFLSHVHAEREKQGNKKIKDIGDNLGRYSHYYQNDGFEDLIYYEGAETPMGVAEQNNRKRRNFDKDTSLEYIFELPIDDASENWFLVTNDELESLMKNKSSFIYGERPSVVPIYAVVNMCASDGDSNLKNEIEPTGKFHYKKNPYIPLTKTPEIYDYGAQSSKFKRPEVAEVDKYETNEVDGGRPDELSVEKNFRKKRSEDVDSNINATTANRVNLTNPSNDQWKAISSPNVVIYTKNDQVVLPTVPQLIKLDDIKIIHEKPAGATSIPHFHVTYWMFYPYSQGKTVCTLNLGPLGPIPIPLVPIFNICLGTKKEFGSHVGDWEHMSLFFRGGMEPDEMYVSAHDAGAFYTFDRLTGTFEFKSQESRKGIFQKPTFPKTVITSENHPVLFSAEGSHGLWATPGKHRFVRVPRLYDINGFGQPWQTWKNVEVIYNDVRAKRSMGGSNPNWMKYRGKWGNPKTKCHPLRRIGLHVCEQTDGPTGIPKKTAHFTCTR